jgi:hypothetical protein
MFRCIVSGWCVGLVVSAAAEPIATGVVYHDRNENEYFDADDRPMPGVRVSNGVQITTTDEQGRYELPVTGDATFFVIKPRGYRTALSEHRLPRFYYTHKPEGSPPSRFPGIAPTGPLPASIDFPLYSQTEPDNFRAVLWADPQPRNRSEVEYIARDVIEELIGVDAAFGVTLGDIMFDDLSLYEDLNLRVALIGIPWYNVIGNHDLNQDARDDRHSDETFERVYGPTYYSFDYGPVHFVVMDTVRWYWKEGENRGAYEGGIDDDQLTFIENDLKHVPKDRLLVLMMHIPLTVAQFRKGERERLFSLLDDRPFTLSISGHTHFQRHEFVGEEMGWHGPERHHHVINVTVSGSWWTGAPDENGIPHSTMRDGAPNGYSIITFDGTRYALEFKAARGPADHQMNIYAPEEIPLEDVAGTQIVVNVFAGSDRSEVKMRFGDEGSWVHLTRYEGVDPNYLRMKQEEESSTSHAGRKLPKPETTNHLWRGFLPRVNRPGGYTLTVTTTDMFGKAHEGRRVIVVR